MKRHIQPIARCVFAVLLCLGEALDGCASPRRAALGVLKSALFRQLDDATQAALVARLCELSRTTGQVRWPPANGWCACAQTHSAGRHRSGRPAVRQPTTSLALRTLQRLPLRPTHIAAEIDAALHAGEAAAAKPGPARTPAKGRHAPAAPAAAPDAAAVYAHCPDGAAGRPCSA